MNSEKKEKMTLKERDIRAQKDLDLFYSEIQLRKTATFDEPKGKYTHYDVLMDGRYYVELKRRYRNARNLPNFFMKKSKIDNLRLQPNAILVMFFNDCWFACRVNQHFMDDTPTVNNPRHAAATEKENNYIIQPSQGKFYEYKTDPETLKKLLAK